MSEQRRPDDHELDDFLSGRDALSRHYKDSVEREGPAPDLDRAILERARQAIEQDQRARKRRFAVPLAMAATVVLSFGVFLAMRDKPGGLPPPTQEIALAKEQKSMVPPPPEVGAVRENDVLRRADAPEPSPANMQEREMRQQVQVAPAAAAPPVVAEAATAKKEEAAGQLAGASAQPEASADAMAAPPLAKAAPRPRAKLRDEKGRASQAWLERIRALKEKGEMEEARKQLDAYRDAHPTVEVPEDLRPLMRPVTPPTP